MAISPNELRAAVEAILFVAGEPVTIDDLTQAFPDETKEALQQQLDELETLWAAREGGFAIEKVAGGYRFTTRPDLDPHLRKYFSRKNEGRLSMAALETLAIIAYRQPMTVPEINDIRGVNTSGVIRTLLDRKMIKIGGRKAVVGSPFLYRTTREFLLHFGLESIQDLPRLEEFTEILGENLAEDLLNAPPVEMEPGSEREHDETEEAASDPAGESTSVAGEALDGEHSEGVPTLAERAEEEREADLEHSEDAPEAGREASPASPEDDDLATPWESASDEERTPASNAMAGEAEEGAEADSPAEEAAEDADEVESGSSERF